MPEKEEKKPEEKKEEKPVVIDRFVESNHSIRIKGKEIKYKVTAGTMVLKEEISDRTKEAEAAPHRLS